MRVESARPSHNALGGWIHPLGGDFKPPVLIPKENPKPTINATKLMREWQAETNSVQIDQLADSLGVSAQSLLDIGCAWATPHRAYAFPMFDGFGNCLGIRLRASDGKKWAVTGSRSGIFMPSTPVNGRAMIVEGPTDCASGITLGFWTVGKPNCACGHEEIKTAFNRLGVRHTICVADNDTPGINGAKKMMQALNIPAVSFVPPCKDLRQFLQLGGTKEMILSTVQSTIWSVPA
jgi:hypothetical protein